MYQSLKPHATRSSLKGKAATVLACSRQISYKNNINKEKDETGNDDNSNVLLADALNLLSPKAEVKKTASYKPSLFETLMGEDSNKNIADPYKGLSLPNFETEKHLDRLLKGIFIATDRNKMMNSHSTALISDKKELIEQIKKAESEDSLISIASILNMRNMFTPKTLKYLILSPKLKNLKRLPFDLASLETEFPDWSEEKHVQIRIILLKKYRDLNKPLLIISDLKERFSTYLEFMKSGKLPSFYERVTWKLYFEYMQPLKLSISKDEEQMIKTMNLLKSSWLILEGSSPSNYCHVANLILNYHEKELNTLQSCYLKVCCLKMTQNLINLELKQYQDPKTSIASQLRRLSIKFKMHSLSNRSEIKTPDDKLTRRTLLTSMNNLVAEEFLSNATEFSSQELSAISTILKELKEYKETHLITGSQPEKSHPSKGDDHCWSNLALETSK